MKEKQLGVAIGGRPIVSRLLVFFDSLDLKLILKHYNNKGNLKAESLIPYLRNECWGVLFYCTNGDCDKDGQACVECFASQWRENREVEVTGIRSG